MKRAIFYFCLALFAWLVIQPNLSQTEPTEARVPENEEVGKSVEDISKQTSESQAVIVIDPGHGGSDSGYTETGKTAEKDIAMQLAVNIGDELSKAGYQVSYTRWYDDVESYNTEQEADAARVATAKADNADYLLAIRFTSGDSLEKGFSVFTQPNNDLLEDLASQIADNIKATSYTTYQGLDTDHYANFTVLSDSSLPAVLLQMGYLSNQEDYDKITDSQFQAKIGEAIAQAFLDTVN